jgi:hypothetical protein
MKDVHKSGLLTTYISDHFPIFSMKTNSLSTNKTTQVFRNFSIVNTREFHSKLQTESCQDSNQLTRATNSIREIL